MVKRNPSLHILRSDLVKVLKTVGVEEPEETANQIMQRSVPYHIKNRYVITGDQKLRRKAAVMVNNTSVSVQKFNGILASCRQLAGHKFVKQAGAVESNDYGVLKQVAELAHEFTVLYQIEPREEGYKTYVLIGLKLMGKKYALGKFKYYNNKIEEAYEAYAAVKGDTTPENTERFYKVWREQMDAYANMVFDIDTDELKYMHMVFGKQEADEAGAKYKDWVVAQFEGLAFATNAPELTQFYGANALSRYEKYIVNAKGKRGATNGYKEVRKEDTDDDSTRFLDDEQKEWFKLLRSQKGT